MKKFLFSFILFASLARADEFQVRDFSAGLYSYPDANTIADNSVSYIQNFYTDIQGMCVERNGYEKRDSTVLGGTKPVRIWRFVDSSSNEWIISFSSRTFYKNTFGNTPTQFGPQTTVAQIPDCADNLGKFVCTDGTDSVWYFDGTSTAAISGAPLGTLIEAWRTRFAIGNITSAQTTLRFSEDGDATSWTIGGNSTDPFSLQIGGANDGQYVRCIRNYLDDLIIGRKPDLWKVSGFDQSDVEVRNISKEIGCLDDGSMREFDNTLLFLSPRGMEEMLGISIKNISEPIRNFTDIFVKNTVNQRSSNQTSLADWAAGSFSSTIYVDTETASGSIQFTYPDGFSIFRDGNMGTKNVWTEFDSGSTTGDVDVSGGNLVLQNDGNTLGAENVRTTKLLENFQPGTTFHFEINSLPTDSGHLSDVYFTLRTDTVTTNPFSSGIVLDIESTTTARCNIVNWSITGRSGAASTTGDFAVPASIDIYLTTTTYNISINTTTALSGTHTATPAKEYGYLSYLKGTLGSGSALIDNFGVAPETFTFTSQAMSIGSLITSWGPIRITDFKEGTGTLVYSFGANSSASFPTYTTILNGGTPVVAVNSFASVKSTFTALAWNDTAKLDDFTVTWFEGTSPPLASWVYDKRYWISFTTNSAGTQFNDSVLVYQRNRTWTLFKGINAAYFATWRDALYFGNSDSTGYVYKFDVGNNDDGASITSVLKTKSYDLGAFTREKDLRYMYTGYLGNSAFTGSFTMTYDLDRSGSSYSLGSVNLNDGTGQLSTRFHFPMSNPLLGREIQYTLTKSGTGDRLKVYGLSTNYSVKEER